jgi:hypothetical protein
MNERIESVMIALITGLCGLILVLVAALAFRQALDLSMHGVRTTGTVEGFTRNRSCRYAEIGFRAPDGHYRQFNDECQTSRHAGETVTIVYVPDRPARAAVESEVWSSFIFLTLVAVGMCGACAVFVIRARRTTG